MNSTEILESIEAIGATSSTAAKVVMLKEGMEDAAFLNIMQLAYNPLVVFGIGKKTMKQIEATTTAATGDGKFDDSTYKLFDDLASRKLSGQEAIDAITKEMTRLDLDGQVLLRRVLLKDLRAGFGDTSLNKARKGTVPVFPYMRCSLPKSSNFDNFDWSKGVISQEKADGMFANVSIFASGLVVVTSRQGSVFDEDGLGTLVPDLAASLKWGTQTHGELVVYQDGELLPREQSNGVMNHIASGGKAEPNQRIVFLAWDQIPLEAAVPKGRYEVPYARRLGELNTQLVKAERSNSARESVKLIPTRIVKSKAEAMKHFGDLLKQNKEGTIVKSPTAIWMDGTSKDQVKLKLEFEVELEVIGFEEGNGKNADTFGSLICASSCRQLVVGVPGWTDQKRQEIAAKGDRYLGTILTVKSNGVMIDDDADNDGAPASLFLPRFVEERFDKFEADDLSSIIAQRDAAIEAA